MGIPEQACPRCRYDLGRLLYCTPLRAEEYFCPSCGLKIQTKCPKCGNWIVMIEPYCSKCGAKNIIFYKRR